MVRLVGIQFPFPKLNFKSKIYMDRYAFKSFPYHHHSIPEDFVLSFNKLYRVKLTNGCLWAKSPFVISALLALSRNGEVDKFWRKIFLVLESLSFALDCPHPLPREASWPSSPEDHSLWDFLSNFRRDGAGAGLTNFYRDTLPKDISSTAAHFNKLKWTVKQWPVGR